MSFDITRKRALETATIELVEGDGSPLLDDAGQRLSVTVHGPGSRQWQQADAERNRRRVARMEKVRGSNKLSAALDHAREDEVAFLVSVTISFNGWDYPPADGKWKLPADEFRAAYSDDALGFIRDHVHREANDWSVFTPGSVKA